MNELEKYISEVFDFEKNQDPASYAERSGPPEELPAVVGLVSLSFQNLEEELSSRIVQMTGAEARLGLTVVSGVILQRKA